MNLAEIFVEVCANRVDISEACLGFSGYRFVALLTLKAIIRTTADDSLLLFFFFFLFFSENKDLTLIVS